MAEKRSIGAIRVEADENQCSRHSLGKSKVLFLSEYPILPISGIVIIIALASDWTIFLARLHQGKRRNAISGIVLSIALGCNGLSFLPVSIKAKGRNAISGTVVNIAIRWRTADADIKDPMQRCQSYQKLCPSGLTFTWWGC